MSGDEPAADLALLPPPIEFLSPVKPSVRPWILKKFDELRSKQSVDWRSEGYTGPVKFQGSCQSCTSHSAAAMLEAWARKAGAGATSLSASHIHFCVMTLGCNDGLDPLRLHRVAVNASVPPDDPSDTWPGAPCTRSGGFVIPKLREITDVEDARRTLSTASPIVAGMELADNFRTGTEALYEPSGVFAGHHAVCVVGYDETTWLIQNSFSDRWRDGGFCRIRIGQGELLTGKWSAIAVG